MGSTTVLFSNVTYYPFGPPRMIYSGNGMAQAWTRDQAYRLTDDTYVDNTATPTYTYDPNGNRLTRSADLNGFGTQAIAMLSQSNRMASINSSTIFMDGAGNLTSDPSRDLSAVYGINNRLSMLNDPAGITLTLGYNGLGELVTTTTLQSCGCSLCSGSGP